MVCEGSANKDRQLLIRCEKMVRESAHGASSFLHGGAGLLDELGLKELHEPESVGDTEKGVLQLGLDRVLNQQANVLVLVGQLHVNSIFLCTYVEYM